MWTRRAFLAVTAAACSAAETRPTAEQIVDAAKAQAGSERAVWVIFHASW